jgi:hypothetical protein
VLRGGGVRRFHPVLHDKQGPAGRATQALVVQER